MIVNGENVMKKRILLVGLIPMLMSGCATREYVHEYLSNQLKPVTTQATALDSRLTSAEAGIATTASNLKNTDAAVAEVQVTLKVHADRLAKNETDIAQLSKTAQEALDRANEAGKLAEGKLIYEVVLSDDKLKFGPGKTTLGGVAEAVLDEFVSQLKSSNKNIFIEIQGHTDSIGTAAHNLNVGAARAEAVKRYLNMNGGIPLHRMSTISYGESEPIADNRYKAGRSDNRRVVLVVIQ
jgi:outer membrane protein OmpA-like peptidoglycan-associated protein